MLPAAAPEPPDRPDQPKIPALLLLAAQRRTDVAFDCQVTHYREGEEPSRSRCIVNRNNEVASFGFGTISGVTGSLEDGTRLYGLEEARLASPQGEWSRYQRSITGDLIVRDVSKSRTAVSDVRSIGMLPNGMCQLFTPIGLLEELERFMDSGPVEFKEVSRDGRPIVEALFPERRRRIVWHFDANDAGLITRVEDWSGDTLTSAAQVDYRVFNGSALPVKVAYLDGAERVRRVSEVEYRDVNSPDIPESLTPSHIGFLVGSVVSVRTGTSREDLVWAGDRLVTRAEFADLKQRGLIEDDPQLVAWLARARARGPVDVQAEGKGTAERFGKPATDPLIVPTPDASWRHRITPLLNAPDEADEWTRYVEQFISRYRLDDDQAARCRLFLQQARERRRQYLVSRRERLEALRQRTYRTAGDARLGREELSLLLRPLDDLFGELKARLERVPTRKQREAVEQSGVAERPNR
ncbi:MAG: hypothetical protein LC135_12120 [Phycisphaerae bacterium]|nr:hypothetical protein [Phycisphaerae bacterium]MCZ2400596.1 hypothetical protein [Phycisphaerae bacterium]NUQ50464.1 hypothetical protein [Phycisphaerae bacterium]